jgi:hypothetical protein
MRSILFLFHCSTREGLREDVGGIRKGGAVLQNGRMSASGTNEGARLVK